MESIKSFTSQTAKNVSDSRRNGSKGDDSGVEESPNLIYDPLWLEQHSYGSDVGLLMADAA
jgi:hypothetical protein